MKRNQHLFITIALMSAAAVALISCGNVEKSGGGPGIGNGAFGATTTTISGKVTLSESVLLKPQVAGLQKISQDGPISKPGSDLFWKTRTPSEGTSIHATLFSKVLQQTSLSNATIDLYDATHPEWLYPVASTTSDDAGNYSLTELTNAEYNKGATYANGYPIPSGLYTLVAYKVGVGQKPVVSVQAVVNRYEGFESVDFEVLDSDIAPTVETMFGVFRNSDGTSTWGGASTLLATNTAIQISFSMPIWRDSLSGISISPAVEGSWSLSADWRTATFYLKDGVTLQPNTLYTVKVNGSDTSNPVYNVYTNPVRKTSVGTFTTSAGADSQSPTAEWLSPSLSEMSKKLDIATPIRIKVNEPLDVNGLYLDATPTLGARTSVIFIGTMQDTTGETLYIYEFGLGQPLALDTTYDLHVVGGRDLAKNALNSLTGSITTKAASDYTAGIDESATPELQAMQAQVYDVFGKWVRSMNDRNLPLFQSLMTGDFYMEYSTINGVDRSDTNHDGRYSLYEFIEMIKGAFKQWDYCGTTMTGRITDGTFIQFNAANPDQADLEFKLDATSTVLSQQCSDAAPAETMYATLKKVNGVWFIVRASIGVDTRDQVVSLPGLIDAGLYEVAAGMETLIADGGQLRSIPTSSYGMKFTWEPVLGVQSLVLALIDSRMSCIGLAVGLPNSLTEVTLTSNTRDGILAELSAQTSDVAVNVTDVFGLNGMNCDGGAMGPMGGTEFLQGGGEYYWEIIGLKTTDVSNIGASSAQTLLNDISSVSPLKRFSIAGLYKEITVYVTAMAANIPYNDVVRGYDAGGAAQITLTMYSPNVSTTGSLQISGHSYQNVPVSFNAAGKAVLDLNLYQGMNWIWMDDGAGLYKWFVVYTTGGIPPAIQFSQVSDDGPSGGILTGNQWDYYRTHTGAQHVTIQGNANPSGLCTMQAPMNYYVSNWKLGAWTQGQFDPDPSTGDFSISNIEIYKGENWIQISGNDSCGKWHNRQIGVSTDTGSPWIPPIMVTTVQQAVKIADYGQSADWDASADLDNYVDIQLKFKLCNGVEAPTVDYNIWSDGGSEYGQIYPDAQGTGNMYIRLYHGMNTVNINSRYTDPSCSSAWYGLRINTSAGVPVVKTAITRVNNVPYDNTGSATVSTCTAQITGTAEPGMVSVYWRGYNGVSYFYENSRRVESDPATSTFTVTVPVVSGPNAYNIVDIYNKNWVSTSMSLYTTSSCSYTSPVLTMGNVENPAVPGVALSKVGSYWQAGALSTVKLTGVSTPGQLVTAYQATCGNEIDFYSTTASAAGAWSLNVAVYEGNNYFDVTDGRNTGYAYVTSSTTNKKQYGTLVTSIKDANTLLDIPFTTGTCGAVTANTGTALAVNIQGTTNEPNSRGYYNTNFGVAPFYFAGGAFEISDLDLFSIPNSLNSVYAYNAYGNLVFNMDLTSTNGQPVPKYVDITSPVHGASVPSSPFIVSAEVSDPMGGNWVPTLVQAFIRDEVTYEEYWYSSDAIEQQMYGYLPITLTQGAAPGDPLAATFYAPAGLTIDTNNPLAIAMGAMDTSSGTWHADFIYVNNTAGYSEYYFKPGAKPAASAPSPAQRFQETLMEHGKRWEAVQH